MGNAELVIAGYGRLEESNCRETSCEVGYGEVGAPMTAVVRGAIAQMTNALFLWKRAFRERLHLWRFGASAIDAEREAQSAEADTALTDAVNETASRMLDAYGNAVLRMAYGYLHNMSDAEEILQETLIKYLQTKPVLESEAHEKAWLLHVAANLSKNRIKYNALRDTDELNEELVAEKREDLAFVWEAVKALPDKYREVVHLFYYEGYATKQIAEILDRKESTVRSDLNRGRQQLKDILKEAYDFAG